MRRVPFFILAVFISTFSQGQSMPSVKVIRDADLYENPPFKSCHSSSIAALPDGKLMAVWFAGPYEGHKEVNIMMAVYANGKWSDSREIANGIIDEKERYPCWNPVLFTNAAGKTFLYYKVGPSPREWWGMVQWTNDNGNNWSKPERLPDGFLGPIKNKPVETGDGFLLHPSSTESLDEKEWKIHIERSDMNSENWEKISVDNKDFGAIQPAIIRHSPTRLQMLCRSRQNRILQSWSNDNGKSWESLSETSVLNPNSGIDAVTQANGQQLLVYNPAKSGAHWSEGRNELQLAFSSDGKEWKNIHTLIKKPGGEFSYPAIIETSDKLIHITYTNDRKNIRHVILQVQSE